MIVGNKLQRFVLGFAFGPLLWAPLSELYGRQILFFGTYMAFTAFNAGNAGSPNIQTLIVLRFFCGLFGSSPLTNAGGVIADMFPASQRGLAMSVFAAAPFMGPTVSTKSSTVERLINEAFSSVQSLEALWANQ